MFLVERLSKVVKMLNKVNLKTLKMLTMINKNVSVNILSTITDNPEHTVK